jgi:ribose 5-phosphate isomerase A
LCRFANKLFFSRRKGENWSKGIPIEVIPIAHQVIKNKIERVLGGKVELREAIRKMGPVVTDNGNFLLDWLFVPDPSRTVQQWTEIERILLTTPGIVEVGLFVGMAEKAYFGMEDGSVQQRVIL